MSYSGRCVPPNRESDTYKKWVCNLWGKNCRWKFKQSWYNRDHNKYNDCLATSEWGRPSFKINGEVCYKKKGKKGKGTEVCAKLDVGSNTLGPAYTVQTDASTVQNTVGKSQAGLGTDQGKTEEETVELDKRILIGGAVVLLLLAG